MQGLSTANLLEVSHLAKKLSLSITFDGHIYMDLKINGKYTKYSMPNVVYSAFWFVPIHVKAIIIVILFFT